MNYRYRSNLEQGYNTLVKRDIIRSAPPEVAGFTISGAWPSALCKNNNSLYN